MQRERVNSFKIIFSLLFSVLLASNHFSATPITAEEVIVEEDVEQITENPVEEEVDNEFSEEENNIDVDLPRTEEKESEEPIVNSSDENEKDDQDLDSSSEILTDLNDGLVDEVVEPEREENLEQNLSLSNVTSNNILKFEDRNEEVRNFKLNLMKAGFASQWVNPNDYYGGETVEATKEFQKYYGLDITGMGDTQTLNQLNNVINNPYQLNNSSESIGLFKTKLMQLGFAPHWATPSNFYGEETVIVVKNFQEFHGLVNNGIIDSVTEATIDDQISKPLSLGLKRPDVKEFKLDLMHAGFAPHWVNPSDYFGNETVEAVNAFQRYYNIAVTGQGDSQTLEMLKNITNSPFQLNNSSPDIQRIKEKLMQLGFAPHWDNPSPLYGRETVQVVEKFQQYYELVVNGIVDDVTSNKINSLLDSPYTLGKSSTAIQQLKVKLMNLGFAPNWNDPSSYYGEETLNVVRTFQNYYNLIENGIIDSNTENMINMQTNRPLSYDLTRPDVKEFKLKLMSAGFAPHWVNPTAYYGSETVTVVQAFQRYYGLKVTGNGDKETLNKLQSVVDSPYQLNKKSQDIKLMKENLMKLGFAPRWNNPSSLYGTETVQVVKHFQEYYGLVPNGIADSVTLEKINTFINGPYNLGKTSESVKQIKVKLMNLGFAPSWSSPSNLYGNETVQVVKSFQSYYDLLVNGIIDSRTEDMINNILNSHYRLGQQSYSIQDVKKDLNRIGYASHWNNPSGYYGSETVTVVKKFQKDNNLPISGIIDFKTMTKIKQTVNNRKIRIYLDPGHGGIPATGGNPGPVYNGIREQDLNLNISLQVRRRLEELGYEVIMSRENDLNSYHNRWQDDLYARPAHANALGADLLVSVHHNAHPTNRSVNGIETYIYGVNPAYPPLPGNEDSHNNPQRITESRKIADTIHKELIKNTGAVDRGVRDGAFIVVREAKMPAVLLELGFMSNSTELSKLRTGSYQQKLINGIVSGIHNYFLLD